MRTPRPASSRRDKDFEKPRRGNRGFSKSLSRRLLAGLGVRIPRHAGILAARLIGRRILSKGRGGDKRSRKAQRNKHSNQSLHGRSPQRGSPETGQGNS